MLDAEVVALSGMHREVNNAYHAGSNPVLSLWILY